MNSDSLKTELQQAVRSRGRAIVNPQKDGKTHFISKDSATSINSFDDETLSFSIEKADRKTLALFDKFMRLKSLPEYQPLFQVIEVEPGKLADVVEFIKNKDSFITKEKAEYLEYKIGNLQKKLDDATQQIKTLEEALAMRPIPSPEKSQNSSNKIDSTPSTNSTVQQPSLNPPNTQIDNKTQLQLPKLQPPTNLLPPPNLLPGTNNTTTNNNLLPPPNLLPTPGSSGNNNLLPPPNLLPTSNNNNTTLKPPTLLPPPLNIGSNSKTSTLPPPNLSGGSNNLLPPPNLLNSGTSNNTTLKPPTLLPPTLNTGGSTLQPPNLLNPPNLGNNSLKPPTLGGNSLTPPTLNAGGLNPPTGLPKLGPPQLGGPSGGGLPLPNLTLPQNTAPKKRLKPVFIEAIAAIKLQQTIFAKAQQNKEDFKMTELEELFESAPSAMAQSKDAGAQGQQQKKSTNICLIPDSKRAYNMSIMIMKFKKYTFKDLRQALIDLKADIITVDACCTLLPFVPLPEEQDACQSYDGKLEDLDQSSQFLMAIYDIPRLAFRLKATIFKSEFDARIEAITKDIQVFKSGCTLLQDNTHFQTFLMAAVEAANVLNQGTARANAGGIKPASIIGFNNVKANKPGITLFSYLVDKIHKKNPKILSFAEEFKVFDDVSKINVEDVIRDVEMIKSQVNTIKIHLESAEKTNPQDTGFINAFKGFYLKAFPIVQETDASAKSAKELYVTVAKLMGEDDESMKKKTCEDFFVVFKQLSDLVLKTMKDLKL